MVDWPVTLPGKLTGITDQRQPTTIRSEVDQGPPIVRNRFTAAIRNLEIPMLFTDAERTLFDTFFVTTLVSGSLSFNWTDPVGGATVVMRFVEPPSFSASGGGSFKYWSCTFKLEIMP